MARLTDAQRKRILAAYVEGSSKSALARQYGVSETTIRNVIKNDPETSKKFEHKKEQNTQSVLAYMDSQRDTVCNLIDQFVEAMGDKGKIAKATIPQLATALGILADKYTMQERKAAEQPTPPGAENNLMEAMNGTAPVDWEGGDDLPEEYAKAKEGEREV